jgi:membrane-bound lytic murein transglycosylase A
LDVGRNRERRLNEASEGMALRINAHYPAISKLLAAILLVAILAGCVAMRPPVPPSPPRPLPPVPIAIPLRLDAARFSELEGWAQSDPRSALLAFQRSCGVLSRKPDDSVLGGVNYAGTVGEWRAGCSAAVSLSASSSEEARGFFEAEFVPYRLSQGSSPGGTPAPGLFTGYYEPQLRGSRTRQGAYQTPLYGVPADLVNVDLGLFRDNLKGQRIVGRVTNGRLIPYPARSEIEGAGLSQSMPLLFVDDPVDAFFLQIQGSGRVVLDDGSVVRAAYGAQNGQPYTAIGAVLIQRGELKREDVSLQSIRAWLAQHPAEAQQLMNANASYVFFTEQPIGDPALGATGAQGVALTPEASLAVDLTLHPLGVPAWLEATAPDPDVSKPERKLDRLLIMQDTGGAIRGAIRGDVYWGFGADAAAIAGRMRSEGRLTVLLPKSVAARLGPNAEFAGPQ